jgi:HEPN domain-containing protein
MADAPTLELAHAWLAKAASDLRSARILADADDPPLDAAVYHCQQAAEKAVKALLVALETPLK